LKQMTLKLKALLAELTALRQKKKAFLKLEPTLREYTKPLEEWEAISNNQAKHPEIQLSSELSAFFSGANGSSRKRNGIARNVGSTQRGEQVSF